MVIAQPMKSSARSSQLNAAGGPGAPGTNHDGASAEKSMVAMSKMAATLLIA